MPVGGAGGRGTEWLRIWSRTRANRLNVGGLTGHLQRPEQGRRQKPTPAGRFRPDLDRVRRWTTRVDWSTRVCRDSGVTGVGGFH
jgi:hypothetical protein